jgi:hypothetical protein
MSYQRLKTDINGGFPLVLDDIRWLQGEFESPFMNYLENICPVDGAVILRGCNFPSAISIGIGSGVAYVSGVGFVNVVGNNSAGWNGTTTFLRPAASTFNPAGNKTFQDGSVNDVYELPRYTVSTGTAGVGDVILNNWVYLNQTFDEKIVTLGTSVTVTSFDIKVEAKRLIIKFTLGGPAGVQNTNYTIFTLNNNIFDPQFTPVNYGIDTNQDLIPITTSAGGAVNFRGDMVNFEFPISGSVIYGL